MLRLGLLWLSLASSPAVLAASTTSATVRDVVYGEVAGETLLLDAVVPSGANFMGLGGCMPAGTTAHCALRRLLEPMMNLAP